MPCRVTVTASCCRPQQREETRRRTGAAGDTSCWEALRRLCEREEGTKAGLGLCLRLTKQAVLEVITQDVSCFVGGAVAKAGLGMEQKAVPVFIQEHCTAQNQTSWSCVTPSFLATPEYQGSASRCRNKRKAPRLLEGFRLASTSIALGTRIKNHRSQTQCPGLQASMPCAAPADPGLMVWGGEDSPPLMGMGGRAEIPPCPAAGAHQLFHWKLQTVTGWV